MKKLLAMALALVMICSLFAVPAMAAPSTVALEMINNGTFEMVGAGTSQTSSTATSFGPAKSAKLKIVDVDGNNVLQITPASKDSGFKSNTFSVTADEKFKLEYDIFVTKEYENGLVRIYAMDKDACANLTYDGHNVIMTDMNGNVVTGAGTTGANHYVPVNKWVHVTADVKATAKGTAYLGHVIRCADANYAATDRIYLDNISLKKEVEGYKVNVTENQPDCGTVIAPAFATGGSTTITVIPNEGYYLYSATLNGRDIKGDFTKTILDGAKATEKYTYNLNGANVEADQELVISYGEYIKTELVSTGNMDSSLTFKASADGISLTQTTEKSKSGSSARLVNATAVAAGESVTMPIEWTGSAITLDANKKYIVSWDIYSDNACKGGNDTHRFYGKSGVTTFTNYSGRNYYDAAHFFETSQWKRTAAWMTGTGSLTTFTIKFVGLADANGYATAYVDNVSIVELTEGGEVPTYYDINVTETNDFGTVTAPERVADTRTATVTVAPDFGYYLASATLNGTDVTRDFEKTYKEGLNGGEVYTYTLNGATLSGDAALVVNYGQYYKTDYVSGGDMSSDVVFTNANDQTSVEQATTVGCGDTYSALITNPEMHKSKVAQVYMGTNLPAGTHVLSFDVNPSANVYSLRLMSDDVTFPGNTSDTTKYDIDNLPADAWNKVYTVINVAEAGEKSISIRFYYRSEEINTADVYVDNFSIAAFTTEKPAPTTATVTISGENAVTSVANRTVTIGGTTTFTVAPMLGYYIESITIGGEEFDGFNAYEKDTYTTEEINKDTEIVVTTAAVASRGDNVATLADVFAEAGTAVTFGKILDTTDATSWGIELTQDGEGVTPYHGGSYLYKAKTTNANGQYAIEFVGLAAGEYTVRSYVYVDGTPTFGAPVTFVVR